jgi:hypothetical protein
MEKLAHKQEQDRQRAKTYRERKAEENQQPRHVTPPKRRRGKRMSDDHLAEPQHDRDVRYLQAAWGDTCETAHAAFLESVRGTETVPAGAPTTTTAGMTTTRTKAGPEEPKVLEEYLGAIEGTGRKYVILYRAVFGPFDGEEEAERWAQARYPSAGRWETDEAASAEHRKAEYATSEAAE